MSRNHRVGSTWAKVGCAFLAPAAMGQGPQPTAYVAVPLVGPEPRIVYSPADGALDMEWNTIDNSGGPLTGAGSLLMEGTVGQPDAGPLTAGNLELIGGFWGLSLDPPPCYANCDGSTAPPILNVLDYQCFLN